MGRPKLKSPVRLRKGDFLTPKSWSKHILECFTTYEMPKAVLIQLSVVGVIYRLLQISIVAYFVGWVLIKEKGYQASENPIYGVSALVRGTAFSFSENCKSRLSKSPEVYSDADLVHPPIQNSGFFLITRVYDCVEQHHYTCPEVPDLLDARCRSDVQCPKGHIAGTVIPEEFAHLTNSSWFDVENYGHGPFTGRCLSKTKTCEVFAWCPVLETTDPQDYAWYSFTPEHDGGNLRYTNKSDFLSNYFVDTSFIDEQLDLLRLDILDQDKVPPLFEVLNFTVHIRNSIEFPFYKVKRSNKLEWMNETYYDSCLYNPNDKYDRHCPRFLIADILKKSGANLWYILLNGGIVDINIKWNCDLDKALEDCVPAYSFRHLGAQPAEYGNNDIVHMEDKYMLEYGNYFTSASQEKRIIHKTNGIQFLITVTGKGSKFSLLQFSMKIGSCLALFGTATLLCNLILIHISRDRQRYKQTICRLRKLRRNTHIIRRLCHNRPPPKPILKRPENLAPLIEFYASRKEGILTPAIKVNVRQVDGKYVARVFEEEYQCPSLLKRKFTPVTLHLGERNSHNLESFSVIEM
ncbi:unnamed protein product [Hymenolepis diminuta]|uniref:P2X purinoceptor n=1 Tax=Hymenolepis diminuta TaxID=6216 RepID=A0A0R3S939_HYMDI|nr:unnamed protein product [Hymenolepis diminuta]VUZ51095.1 unnamed protein product [Hymenolepis diminuta]